VSYIVLDEAQARIIAQAKGDVEVRDGNGKHLGYIARGFTDDDIRIARERAESKVTCLSTAEVLDRLR
jgi:hypothetical protein